MMTKWQSYFAVINSSVSLILKSYMMNHTRTHSTINLAWQLTGNAGSKKKVARREEKERDKINTSLTMQHILSLSLSQKGPTALCLR
jgi:hypothetical protein